MADTKSLITQSEWWLYDSEAESTEIITRSNLHRQHTLLRAL